MKGVHTEESFEALIAAELVGAGGYEVGEAGAFDRELAVMPEVVVGFIRETQPKAWKKLEAIHGGKLAGLVVRELCKWMDGKGALETLRHGFPFYGQQLRVAFFRPGHGLNPEVWALYGKNRLMVVRQLRYDPSNENSLDLVLFLNGLPVVTAELKNAMTGQTVEHAKRQYCEKRDPKAPIFRWKARALVHFAVDTDEAWMTTRLVWDDTFFLPFNRGNGGGKGNPPVDGKHRTSYVWEEVWQRDSLLDLVGRFLHVQVEERTDPNTGKKSQTETLIFPRYHQLDCVRRLVGAARDKGPGTNYLVQHSAGSGKSNSIAWLAHRLASLHDEADRKVYDSVVVLTDRKVLDQQLQSTIYQFEHKTGVVERIDKHSDQLAAALAAGAPIIISTIHKFGFIQDKMEKLPERRYAIIVDEAHSSQSGEMAVAVKGILADATLEARAAEEAEALSVPDQLALRKALERGPQPNMSFFAFTATPKFKTLELFGHKGSDGKPAPFHLYSMRQAIEEGFILDVLAGYITYARFASLAKAVGDDPKLNKSKALRALKQFVELHPSNIAQKVEIVVEHFRACVAHLLDGRAKAMVVTGSRLMAVRYKEAMERYVRERGYRDVRCLVAFSGEVKDEHGTGETYTEVGMNGGIREAELPEKFASDAFNVLIVANKYQTGFDQPLLMAMYVDKRLDGVQAVQTLSRLNRTKQGKEATFVLDFVNRRQDILEAFQVYYEKTTTAEDIEPQRLYELHHALEGFQLWTAAEVDGFAEVFFALRADQKVWDNAKLNARVDPAVERWRAMKLRAEEAPGGEREQAVKQAVERQEAFRGTLSAFVNLYGFMGQIVPFQDARLEKLYAFGRMLLRKLPRPDQGGPVDLGDDVVLKSLRIKKAAEGALVLQKGQDGEVVGPKHTGTGAATPPIEQLSTILEIINQRMQTGYEAQGLIEEVVVVLVGDDEVRQAALANDKGNFEHVFGPKLDDALVERLAKHTEFVNAVFADPVLRDLFRGLMLDRVYGDVREQERAAAAEAEPEAAKVLPFRRVAAGEARPYENCIPALDLKVAAGGFSPSQLVGEDQGTYDWVTWDGLTRPAPELFVAQVVGESMNRRIPNGAWCLFRLAPKGSREGKVVLAQHRDIADPELGGKYTVKRYESAKEPQADGTWRHRRVTLHPESTDAQFQPIVLEALEDGELVIVAELVEVLG